MANEMIEPGETGRHRFYRSAAGLALNALLFQVGWFSCVLGAAAGYWWFGPLVVAAVLCIHAALTPQWRQEIGIALSAAVLGFVVDTILVSLGVFRLVSSPFPEWMTAPWLVAMWANFAVTLRHSMGWLLGRYWLASGLGAVGGLLAYWAGARLGAMEITIDMLHFALILAFVWAAATPLIVYRAGKQ